MGDNIHLGDRDGVRTPMQWSVDRNGGFSRADPASLVLPPIMDPIYGFYAVNVEAQAARSSIRMLNWTRRMLAVRKRFRAFGRGTPALPLSRQSQGAGLSARAAQQRGQRRDDPLREQSLADSAGGGARSRRFRRPGAGRYRRRLGVPAGGAAYLLAHAAALRFLSGSSLPARRRCRRGTNPRPRRCRNSSPLWCVASSPKSLSGPARGLLETEVLPEYLPKRRWFAAKGDRLRSTRIAYAVPVPEQPT